MPNDLLGNELKVGDIVLVQMGGITKARVVNFNPGGLSAIVPGTKQLMLTPPTIKLSLDEIEIQFDPTKPVGLWKTMLPEEKTAEDISKKAN